MSRVKTAQLGGRQVQILEDGIGRPSARVRIDRETPRPIPAWAIAGHCRTPGCTTTSKPEYEQGEVLPDSDPPPPVPPADWREVRMPERFRKAEIRLDHRGYPIFYVIVPRGGVPRDKRVDFRVLNAERHERCAEQKLCMICGLPMTGRLYFIGGPMCVQNRVFGDTAMHEECARYSLQVCPYLTIATKNYSHRPINTTAYDELETDPHVITTKPERVCIYVCRQYRGIRERDPSGKQQGKLVVIVEPAEWVEWYTVDGNYLCRTKPTRYGQ